MRTTVGWMVLLALTLAACAGLTACGGGSTGSTGAGGSGGGEPEDACGNQPLSCPSGETCWFSSAGVFTCQPSGSAKEGEACAPLVDQPTCGDGLLCVKQAGAEGACTRLCDPAIDQTCGAEEGCILVQTEESGETHVCM